MRFQLEHLVFRPGPARDKIICHFFRAPLLDEFGGVGFQAVDAGKGFRRRVVPLHQLRDVRSVAPALQPAVDQPFGMRIAEGGLGNLQFGQQFSGLLRFAQISAQDGVDETGLRAEAELRLASSTVSCTAAWAGMRSSQKIW